MSSSIKPARPTGLIICGIPIIIQLAWCLPMLDMPLYHDETFNSFFDLISMPFDFGFMALARGESARPFLQLQPMDWSRQLAIHPPGLSIFYYLWISVFGDSETSLHVPTLAAGLASLSASIYLAQRLFGSSVAFVTGCAMACSFSHLTYSLRAEHAIFEQLLLILSFVCLLEVYRSGSARAYSALLALNAIGALLFYHYLLFLCLEVPILAASKDGLRRSRAVAAGAALAVALALFIVARGIYGGYYDYDFWISTSGGILFKYLREIPFTILSFAGEGDSLVPGVVSWLVFAMFIAGASCMALRPPAKASVFYWLMLALIALPFALYLAISFAVPRFGHQRNFFYLLPLYIMIAAYGWNRVSGDAGFGTALAVVFCVWTGLGAARNTLEYCDSLYLDRERILLAAAFDDEIKVVPTNPLKVRQFLYYKMRLGDANLFPITLYKPPGLKDELEALEEALTPRLSGGKSLRWVAGYREPATLDCKLAPGARCVDMLEVRHHVIDQMPFSWLLPRSYEVFSYSIAIHREGNQAEL